MSAADMRETALAPIALVLVRLMEFNHRHIAGESFGLGERMMIGEEVNQ